MTDYYIENRLPKEEEIVEILELMNDVWGKYYYEEGIWRYDRNVLDLIFKSPRQESDFYWIVKLKQTHKIVGFALVILWEVMIHNKGPYSILYGTFITTDTALQKQGIGTAISKEVVEAYNRHKFIGSIFNVEETSVALKTISKERWKRMITIRSSDIAYIRPLNLQKKGKLMDMKWYEKIGAKLIQGAKKSTDPNIRPVRLQDIEAITLLLNSYSNTVDIARIWKEGELKTYITSPMYRGKVYLIESKVKAVISAMVYSLYSKGVIVKIAVIENSHYGHIGSKVQKELIKSLLYDLKMEGIAAAIDFGVGYRDLTPLKKNRFLSYPRKMATYMVARPDWNLDSEPFNLLKEDEEKVYIEVT